MKPDRRIKKWLLVLGTAGVISLSVCGCRTKVEENDSQEMEIVNEEEPKAADQDITGETEESEDTPEESAASGTDDLQELLGDIREIGEGKFVISEAIVEELGDAEVMVSI